MHERVNFDALFTKKFFLIPEKKENKKLTFDVPTSIATMATFMSSRQGARYQAEARQAIHALKQWCKQNDIPTTNLETFESHFPFTGYDSALDLLKEGTPLLVQIVALLESKTVPLAISKKIIQDMLPDLAVCPPGAYKAIYTASLKFSERPEDILMAIRKELSEQVILEMIDQYNRYFNVTRRIELDEIVAGNITHYVNKVINTHSSLLGIQLINDDLEPNDFNPAIVFMLPEFKKRIASAITVSAVMDQILDKLAWSEFKEKIANCPVEKISEFYAEFESRLNLYGVDEQFQLTMIFDQEAISDGQYLIHSEAEDYLYGTILHRIASSGFLDLTTTAQIYNLNDTDKLFYFSPHSLTLSSVLSKNETRIPFLSYCIDQLSAGRLDCLQQCPQFIPLIETALSTLFFSKGTSLQRMKNILSAIKTLVTQDGHDGLLVSRMLFKKHEYSIDSLCNYLQIVGKQESLAFIMQLPPTRLNQLLAIKNNVSKVLSCLADEHVMMFLIMIKERGLLNTVISSQDRFLELATRISSKDYPFFLTAILSVEDLSLIDLGINDVLAFIKKMSPEQVTLFIRHLGQAYWQEHINDAEMLFHVLASTNMDLRREIIDQLGRPYLNVILPYSSDFISMMTQIEYEQRMDFLILLDADFIQKYLCNWNDAGMVLAMIDPSCYSSFLNVLSGGTINQIILNVEHLLQALTHLQAAQRVLFLQQLGACHLQRVIPDAGSFTRLLVMLQPNDYVAYLTLFNSYSLAALFKGPQSLSAAVNSLPDNCRMLFLKAFSSFFSQQELERYKGGDDSIYRNLSQFKAVKPAIASDSNQPLWSSSNTFLNELHTRRRVVSVERPLPAKRI